MTARALCAVKGLLHIASNEPSLHMEWRASSDEAECSQPNDQCV